MISVRLLAMIAEAAYTASRTFSNVIVGEEDVAWATLDTNTKVKFIETVRNTIDLKVDDPAIVHDNWMTAMVKNGWVYGEEYSRDNKTHPCLKPYSSLEVGQQTKDQLYLSVLKPFYVL